MTLVISKEELEKLKEIKGEARGVGIKNVLDFVIKDKGEEGLKKLEDTMAELGLPMKYKEMKMMQFYPLYLYLAVNLVMKEIFDYDDRKFQEMGLFMAKSSFILRLLLKHFISIDNTINQAPRAWRGYFSVGSLEIGEINKSEKYLIARLKNFDFHPLHCEITKGFLSAAIQMVVKNETTCEQIKSSFKGAEYNEFVVRW